MVLIKLVHIELCKFILSGIAPSDSACVCVCVCMYVCVYVYVCMYVCMYVCTDDVVNNRLEILNKGSGWFIGVISCCFSALIKAL